MSRNITREGEERFRTALKSSPVVVFNQDRELRYTWIFNSRVGLTREQVLGRRDEDLFSDTEASSLTRIKRQVLETGIGAREIVPIADGAGARTVYDLTVEPLRSPQGDVTGITCVALDITDHQALQDDLEARLRQQAAVAELGHRALSGTPVASLLEHAAAAVAGALELDRCGVFELLPGNESLCLRAGVGWPADLVGRAVVPAGRGTLTGHVLLQNRPVLFEDLPCDVRFQAPDLLLRHGIVSGAVVPISGRNRPFGVLAALSTTISTLTHDDVFFLQSVATLLVAAIERQSLEKEVLEVGEEERRRIGQDLHDGLCQHLIAAGLMAYSLEQRLAAAASEDSIPPEVRKVLQREATQAADVARMLREGASQAREIAQGLMPLDTGILGLAVALRELTRTVEKCTGVHCSFRTDERAVIQDSFVAGHLLRIAQESVNNAIKHSGAEHITVSLEARRGAITLTVRDDGVGLPPPEKLSGAGFHTMKYRAAMINARLSVSSGKPRKAGRAGTTVRCSLSAPLAAQGC